MRGLCGKWFVPRQDHHTLPKCTGATLSCGRWRSGGRARLTGSARPEDELQPAADQPFHDQVYVRAWWQRSKHLHGVHRDDA